LLPPSPPRDTNCLEWCGPPLSFQRRRKAPISRDSLCSFPRRRFFASFPELISIIFHFFFFERWAELLSNDCKACVVSHGVLPPPISPPHTFSGIPSPLRTLFPLVQILQRGDFHGLPPFQVRHLPFFRSLSLIALRFSFSLIQGIPFFFGQRFERYLRSSFFFQYRLLFICMGKMFLSTQRTFLLFSSKDIGVR